jgi:hypothetical protein
MTNSFEIGNIFSNFSKVERKVRLLPKNQGKIQLRYSVMFFIEAILDLF